MRQAKFRVTRHLHICPPSDTRNFACRIYFLHQKYGKLGLSQVVLSQVPLTVRYCRDSYQIAAGFPDRRFCSPPWPPTSLFERSLAAHMPSTHLFMRITVCSLRQGSIGAAVAALRSTCGAAHQCAHGAAHWGGESVPLVNEANTHVLGGGGTNSERVRAAAGQRRATRW